jgi:hypothetical protein
VARRLEPKRLPVFAADDDVRARYTAAERANPGDLHAFEHDPEDIVRRLVVRRREEES